MVKKLVVVEKIVLQIFNGAFLRKKSKIVLMLEMYSVDEKVFPFFQKL